MLGLVCPSILRESARAEEYTTTVRVNKIKALCERDPDSRKDIWQRDIRQLRHFGQQAHQDDKH